jgi:DNA repair protein RAD7
VQQAEREAAAAEDGDGPSNEVEEHLQAESSAMAAERSKKKRKRDQDEATAKIKKDKEAKKKASKKKKRGLDDESDFGDVMDMYKKAPPLPGQLKHCELCDKRFTVTPYSKAGPDGGLLCTPCGKEMHKEAKRSPSFEGVGESLRATDSMD